MCVYMYMEDDDFFNYIFIFKLTLIKSAGGFYTWGTCKRKGQSQNSRFLSVSEKHKILTKYFISFVLNMISKLLYVR